ncbi:alpha-xenorhabdolysin family binary toxin subunit A [Parerythrobacter jejuensis]|uniref:Alpha-xenorhabdolysin family binary toxin subunit A n=1 Tax=Parerythrobacter jejuensis TaxID=795812 RepID=A0A845ANY4_9SPHN|nr:alpha-xenorhabdolysin family binary toxin subunit A [Parerythrobacter jejuensis]MXP31990.1 alpha-xenorhabdolysin family binary toxin subunit A [Parerythrobacter jejuensis]
MADEPNVTPANDTDEALTNLSKDEWLSMCAFFDAARYKNPTTEASMRLALGMQADEKFKPEFEESVALFGTLATIGHDFETKVKGQVLGLADDIYSYSILAEKTYGRFEELIDKFDWDGPDGVQDKLDALVKLWGADKVSGRSAKIRTRIKEILDKLVFEASSRAEKAEALYKTILDPDTGLKTRVKSVQKEFRENGKKYKAKFGEESADVIKFRKDVEALQAELKSLRKKESDEVIVLSTSPAYLAIPLFGPLILAGVDIGVGVDLALTRAKIESKQEEAKKIQAKLDTSISFVAHYKTGETMIEKIVADIDVVAPQLEKLGQGWRAIAADIGKIAHMLSEDGSQQIAQEKWDQFIVTLRTASDMWTKVGQRADVFRRFSVPKSIDDPSEIPEPLAA